MIVGLKIKALLSHISKNYECTVALAKLNKHFPKSGIKMKCPPENEKEIDKLNKQMQKFRMFVLRLLMNDRERQKYVQEELDEEYGAEFMVSLKQLVRNYLEKMEKYLPRTAIEQFLAREPDSSISVEATSSPSCAVDKLIELLDSGPPSEDSLINFLQMLLTSQNNNPKSPVSSENDSSDSEEEEDGDRINEDEGSGQPRRSKRLAGDGNSRRRHSGRRKHAGTEQNGKRRDISKEKMTEIGQQGIRTKQECVTKGRNKPNVNESQTITTDVDTTESESLLMPMKFPGHTSNEQLMSAHDDLQMNIHSTIEDSVAKILPKDTQVPQSVGAKYVEICIYSSDSEDGEVTFKKSTAKELEICDIIESDIEEDVIILDDAIFSSYSGKEADVESLGEDDGNSSPIPRKKRKRVNQSAGLPKEKRKILPGDCVHASDSTVYSGSIERYLSSKQEIKTTRSGATESLSLNMSKRSRTTSLSLPHRGHEREHSLRKVKSMDVGQKPHKQIIEIGSANIEHIKPSRSVPDFVCEKNDSSVVQESPEISVHIPMSGEHSMTEQDVCQKSILRDSKACTESASDATYLPHDRDASRETNNRTHSPIRSDETQIPDSLLRKNIDDSPVEISKANTEIENKANISKSEMRCRRKRSMNIIKGGQFHPFKRVLRSGKSIDDRIGDSEDDFQMHSFKRILRSGKFVIEKDVPVSHAKAKMKYSKKKDKCVKGNVKNDPAVRSLARDRETVTISKEIGQKEIYNVDDEPGSPASVIIIEDFTESKEKHEKSATGKASSESDSNNSEWVIPPSSHDLTVSPLLALELQPKDEVDAIVEPIFPEVDVGRVVPLSSEVDLMVEPVLSKVDVQYKPLSSEAEVGGIKPLSPRGNVRRNSPLSPRVDVRRIEPLPPMGDIERIEPSSPEGGVSRKKPLSLVAERRKEHTSQEVGYHFNTCTIPELSERYCLSDSDCSPQQFSQNYCESRQDWLRSKARMQIREPNGRFIRTDYCPVRRRHRYTDSKHEPHYATPSRRGLWCKKLQREESSSDDETDCLDLRTTKEQVNIQVQDEPEQAAKQNTSREMMLSIERQTSSQSQESSRTRTECKPPSPHLASTAENSQEHLAAEPFSPGPSSSSRLQYQNSLTDSTTSSPFRTPPESPISFKGTSQDSASPKLSKSSPRLSYHREGTAKSPLSPRLQSPKSPRCTSLMFDFYKKKAAASGSDMDQLWENRPSKQFDADDSEGQQQQQQQPSGHSSTPKRQRSIQLFQGYQDPVSTLTSSPKTSNSLSPTAARSPICQEPHLPLTPLTDICKRSITLRSPSGKVPPPASTSLFSVAHKPRRTRSSVSTTASMSVKPIDLSGNKDMRKVHFMNALRLCKMSTKAKMSVERIKKKNSQKRPLRATTEKKRTTWTYLNLKLVPNLVVTRLPQKVRDGKTPIKNGNGLVYVSTKQYTSHNRNRNSRGKPVVLNQSLQNSLLSGQRVRVTTNNYLFNRNSDSFRNNELLSHTSSSSELLSPSVTDLSSSNETLSSSLTDSDFSALLKTSFVSTANGPVQIDMSRLISPVGPGGVDSTTVLPSGQDNRTPVDNCCIVAPSPCTTPETRMYAKAVVHRNCPLSCCNNTPRIGNSVSPELHTGTPPSVLGSLSVNCDNQYSFVVPDSMTPLLSPTLSISSCNQYSLNPLKTPGSKRLAAIPTMREHLQNAGTTPCLVKLDKFNVGDANKMTREDKMSLQVVHKM
ncbi:uncharacterized protein LOC144437741 isoform X2 [Glandiceps talaboti]